MKMTAKHYINIVIYIGLLCTAAIKHIKWMKNIIIFINGYATFVSVFFAIVLSIEESSKSPDISFLNGTSKLLNELPRLPKKCSNLLDLLILFIMASAGWFWMAACYVLQITAWMLVKERIKWAR